MLTSQAHLYPGCTAVMGPSDTDFKRRAACSCKLSTGASSRYLGCQSTSSNTPPHKHQGLQSHLACLLSWSQMIWHS